jgi:hypothetical protein
VVLVTSTCPPCPAAFTRAQLVSAGGEAGMEFPPEPRQHGKWLDITGALLQAVHHGLRSDHGIFGENT